MPQVRTEQYENLFAQMMNDPKYGPQLQVLHKKYKDFFALIETENFSAEMQTKILPHYFELHHDQQRLLKQLNAMQVHNAENSARLKKLDLLITIYSYYPKKPGADVLLMKEDELNKIIAAMPIHSPNLMKKNLEELQAERYQLKSDSENSNQNMRALLELSASVNNAIKAIKFIPEFANMPARERLTAAYARIAATEFVDNPALRRKYGLADDVLIRNPADPSSNLKFALGKRALSIAHGALLVLENHHLGKAAGQAKIDLAMQAIFAKAQEFFAKTLAQPNFVAKGEYKKYIEEHFEGFVCEVGLEMAKSMGLKAGKEKKLEKDLILAERLANWERRTKQPIATINESGEIITVKIDTPIVHLTPEIKAELNKIKDANPPLWFTRLEPLQQHWMKKNLQAILDGKLISPPSVLRNTPLACNFTQHQNKIYKDGVLVQSVESYRRSTVPPIALVVKPKVPKSLKAIAHDVKEIYIKSDLDAERNRLALLIANQLSSAVNSQAPNSFWVDPTLNSKKTDLDQSLLTPLPIDPAYPGEDNNLRMRDETANAIKTAAKDAKGVIKITSNWPINSERGLDGVEHFKFNADATNQITQTFSEIFKVIFKNNPNFKDVKFDELKPSQLQSIIDEVKDNKNKHLALFASPDQELKYTQFCMALEAFKDYQQLWQECTGPNGAKHYDTYKANNIELFAAALMNIMVTGFGGVVTGGCKSAKDRKGAELTQITAMIEYYHRHNGELPKYTDGINVLRKEQREDFAQIFARQYADGHQQQMAGENSYGCDGCLAGANARIKQLMTTAAELGIGISQLALNASAEDKADIIKNLLPKAPALKNLGMAALAEGMAQGYNAATNKFTNLQKMIAPDIQIIIDERLLENQEALGKLNKPKPEFGKKLKFEAESIRFYIVDEKTDKKYPAGSYVWDKKNEMLYVAQKDKDLAEISLVDKEHFKSEVAKLKKDKGTVYGVKSYTTLDAFQHENLIVVNRADSAKIRRHEHLLKCIANPHLVKLLKDHIHNHYYLMDGVSDAAIAKVNGLIWPQVNPNLDQKHSVPEMKAVNVDAKAEIETLQKALQNAGLWLNEQELQAIQKDNVQIHNVWSGIKNKALAAVMVAQASKLNASAYEIFDSKVFNKQWVDAANKFTEQYQQNSDAMKAHLKAIHLNLTSEELSKVVAGSNKVYLSNMQDNYERLYRRLTINKPLRDVLIAQQIKPEARDGLDPKKFTDVWVDRAIQLSNSYQENTIRLQQELNAINLIVSPEQLTLIQDSNNALYIKSLDSKISGLTDKVSQLQDQVIRLDIDQSQGIENWSSFIDRLQKFRQDPQWQENLKQVSIHLSAINKFLEATPNDAILLQHKVNLSTLQAQIKTTYHTLTKVYDTSYEKMLSTGQVSAVQEVMTADDNKSLAIVRGLANHGLNQLELAIVELFKAKGITANLLVDFDQHKNLLDIDPARNLWWMLNVIAETNDQATVNKFVEALNSNQVNHADVEMLKLAVALSTDILMFRKVKAELRTLLSDPKNFNGDAIKNTANEMEGFISHILIKARTLVDADRFMIIKAQLQPEIDLLKGLQNNRNLLRNDKEDKIAKALRVFSANNSIVSLIPISKVVKDDEIKLLVSELQANYQALFGKDKFIDDITSRVFGYAAPIHDLANVYLQEKHHYLNPNFTKLLTLRRGMLEQASEFVSKDGDLAEWKNRDETVNAIKIEIKAINTLLLAQQQQAIANDDIVGVKVSNLANIFAQLQRSAIPIQMQAAEMLKQMRELDNELGQLKAVINLSHVNSKDHLLLLNTKLDRFDSQLGLKEDRNVVSFKAFVRKITPELLSEIDSNLAALRTLNPEHPAIAQYQVLRDQFFKQFDLTTPALDSWPQAVPAAMKWRGFLEESSQLRSQINTKLQVHQKRDNIATAPKKDIKNIDKDFESWKKTLKALNNKYPQLVGDIKADATVDAIKARITAALSVPMQLVTNAKKAEHTLPTEKLKVDNRLKELVDQKNLRSPEAISGNKDAKLLSDQSNNLYKLYRAISEYRTHELPKYIHKLQVYQLLIEPIKSLNPLDEKQLVTPEVISTRNKEFDDALLYVQFRLEILENNKADLNPAIYEKLRADLNAAHTKITADKAAFPQLVIDIETRQREAAARSVAEQKQAEFQSQVDAKYKIARNYAEQDWQLPGLAMPAGIENDLVKQAERLNELTNFELKFFPEVFAPKLDQAIAAIDAALAMNAEHADKEMLTAKSDQLKAIKANLTDWYSKDLAAAKRNTPDVFAAVRNQVNDLDVRIKALAVRIRAIDQNLNQNNIIPADKSELETARGQISTLQTALGRLKEPAVLLAKEPAVLLAMDELTKLDKLETDLKRHQDNIRITLSRYDRTKVNLEQVNKDAKLNAVKVAVQKAELQHKRADMELARVVTSSTTYDLHHVEASVFFNTLLQHGQRSNLVIIDIVAALKNSTTPVKAWKDLRPHYDQLLNKAEQDDIDRLVSALQKLQTTREQINAVLVVADPDVVAQKANPVLAKIKKRDNDDTVKLAQLVSQNQNRRQAVSGIHNLQLREIVFSDPKAVVTDQVVKQLNNALEKPDIHSEFLSIFKALDIVALTKEPQKFKQMRDALNASFLEPDPRNRFILPGEFDRILKVNNVTVITAPQFGQIRIEEAVKNKLHNQEDVHNFRHRFTRTSEDLAELVKKFKAKPFDTKGFAANVEKYVVLADRMQRYTQRYASLDAIVKGFNEEQLTQQYGMGKAAFKLILADIKQALKPADAAMKKIMKAVNGKDGFKKVQDQAKKDAAKAKAIIENTEVLLRTGLSNLKPAQAKKQLESQKQKLTDLQKSLHDLLKNIAGGENSTEAELAEYTTYFAIFNIDIDECMDLKQQYQSLHRYNARVVELLANVDRAEQILVAPREQVVDPEMHARPLFAPAAEGALMIQASAPLSAEQLARLTIPEDAASPVVRGAKPPGGITPANELQSPGAVQSPGSKDDKHLETSGAEFKDPLSPANRSPSVSGRRIASETRRDSVSESHESVSRSEHSNSVSELKVAEAPEMELSQVRPRGNATVHKIQRASLSLVRSHDEREIYKVESADTQLNKGLCIEVNKARSTVSFSPKANYQPKQVKNEDAQKLAIYKVAESFITLDKDNRDSRASLTGEDPELCRKAAVWLKTFEKMQKEHGINTYKVRELDTAGKIVIKEYRFNIQQVTINNVPFVPRGFTIDLKGAHGSEREQINRNCEELILQQNEMGPPDLIASNKNQDRVGDRMADFRSTLG